MPTPDPSTADVQHPHLQRCLAEAKGLLTRVRSLAETYTPHQLTWKPDPSVWNMLECFDHLIVVDEMYYPNMRTAIDTAPASAHDGQVPFKPSLPGRIFHSVVKPNPAFKIKTFRSFNPRPALTDTAVIDRFAAHQDTMMDLIRQADGLNLRAVKLASPLSSLLRFSLGDVFWFLLAHQQRHIQQAERLAQHPGFPSRMDDRE